MASFKEDKSMSQIESMQQGGKINWSQMAFSSLITLVISVLAGVAIFYFTNKPAPTPKLLFEKVPPTSFSTDKVKTVIQSFRVWNDGNKEAEDVQISIKLPKNAVIADQKAEPSGGDAMSVQFSQVNSSTIFVNIPLLNPSESVNFAFLLDNTTSETFEVEVRARGIVGEARSINSPTTPDTMLNDSLFLVVAGILVIFQFIILIFLTRRIEWRRFLRLRNSDGAAFNNLGFRLLHIGQIDEAKRYLQFAIEKNPDAYPLGNMAYIYALEGKHAEAVSLCEIAREYASIDSTKAFLEYCLFCIYLAADKKIEALPHLREALIKDKTTITTYYNRNVNIARWKDDPDILSAFLSVK